MDKSKEKNIIQILTSSGYTAVPIRLNLAGQLLIDAKINGVDGIYILDTGAGSSVVDFKQCDNLKLTMNTDEAEFTGGGLGGHGIENIPSYNNVVEINGVKIENVSLAVMSLTSAWDSLASIGSNDELFGFLGVDILKSGNAIMEFESMTLYLKQPQL